MRILPAIATAALISGLIAATPARAADEYVFNVPVRIQNAQYIKSGAVDCTVQFYNWRGTSTGVARGSSPLFEVVGGNFVQTLHITAPMPDTSTREEQTRWNCSLRLLYRGADGAQSWVPNVADADRADWYQRKTGQAARAVTMTQADFPR